MEESENDDAVNQERNGRCFLQAASESDVDEGRVLEGVNTRVQFKPHNTAFNAYRA